jgi:ribosome biogenesis GTPase A
MDNVVQWFPGHMAKTRRLIAESLKQVDAVAELLDARAPLSSRNPELDAMAAGKPRLVLLNKCDLADPAATRAWAAWFAGQGAAALPVDCRSGKGLQKFVPLCRLVLAPQTAQNAARGMPGKALRLLVAGIPNTGKSSFINRMAGQAKAQVANRPGVTRRGQWVAVAGGLELLDTPGVLWPKFDDPATGDRLAFLGAVKSEILDGETIALRLLATLKALCPNQLAARYRLPDTQLPEPPALLAAIARARGMLLRGGEPDTARAANTLWEEFRGGQLGRVTLEWPPA